MYLFARYKALSIKNQEKLRHSKPLKLKTFAVEHFVSHFTRLRSPILVNQTSKSMLSFLNKILHPNRYKSRNG